MNRYLFLDIDGVLNTHQQNLESIRLFKCHSIDRSLASIINEVIISTRCKIVITSAWRKLYYNKTFSLRGFQLLMQSHGLFGEAIVGFTAEGDEQMRGILISNWINKQFQKDFVYAVVDDADDGLFEHYDLHFVQTNCHKGVSSIDRDRLIYILGMN